MILFLELDFTCRLPYGDYNTTYSLDLLLDLNKGLVFSQVPLLRLDYRWYKIHPPIDGLLPLIGIEAAAFQYYASKVATFE